MMKRYSPLFMAAVVGIILALSVVRARGAASDTGAISSIPLQSSASTGVDQQVTVDSDPIASQSLENLVRTAPIIAIGSITPAAEIVNMARDPDDATGAKADPTIYGIGQVYTFHVEKYLHGAGPETLKVVQAEGMINTIDSSRISAEQLQKARGQGYAFVALSSNRYVMFLEPLRGFDPVYVTGSGGKPWRFRIEAETVQPESADPDLNAFFKPAPVDEFINQIEALLITKR